MQQSWGEALFRLLVSVMACGLARGHGQAPRAFALNPAVLQETKDAMKPGGLEIDVSLVYGDEE